MPFSFCIACDKHLSRCVCTDPDLVDMEFGDMSYNQLEDKVKTKKLKRKSDNKRPIH